MELAGNRGRDAVVSGTIEALTAHQALRVAAARTTVLLRTAQQAAKRLRAGERWQGDDLVFCTRTGTPLAAGNASPRASWLACLEASSSPITHLRPLRKRPASPRRRSR